MPYVDIDSLLNSTDGWNLTLTIGGEQFVMAAPPKIDRELLEKILSGESVTQANRPELENLIAPMILEGRTDVTKWRLGELVGAATAIAIHAREIYTANQRGICLAVFKALRHGQSQRIAQASVPAAMPNSTAAPIPDAPGGNIAEGKPIVQSRMDPGHRKNMEQYVEQLTGVAVPPGTSDADLCELSVNAGKSAMRPAEQKA